MNRLAVSLLLALSLVGAGLEAQSKPRIAIIPLNYISVSKAEASILTELLETGFVKTEGFDVLEQTRVAEILDAQEFSLSDCTDEKCAVEFGKLLAAEQIVLGSVSRIGGKYVLNAKIIDVTTGRNIRADRVESDSIETLTGQVDILAFKMAGLTYTEGGAVQVAVAFGEIFIETDPPGAEILLNGIRKGVSPLVLEKVPVGRVTVEARKDNLWAGREVEAKSGTLTEVSLTLAKVLGRLFLKTTAKDVRVVLDGKDMGVISSGLYRDIPAGEHVVSLTGDGVYWEATVTVAADKTETVEAYPREVGSLTYRIPDGGRAEIQGNDYRKVVYESGTLEHLPAGTYTVDITAKDRKLQRVTLTVRRGAEIVLAPVLEPTDEYRAALAAAEKEKALSGFRKRLAEQAALAQSGSPVGSPDIEAAKDLVDKIGASPYGLDEMAAQAADSLAALTSIRETQTEQAALADLVDLREAKQAEHDRLVLKRDRAKKSAPVLFILGAAGLGGAGTLFALGTAAYDAYVSAVYTDEAVALHGQLDLYKVMSLVCAGAGGGFTILGGIQLGGLPRIQALELEISELDARIAVARGGGM